MIAKVSNESGSGTPSWRMARSKERIACELHGEVGSLAYSSTLQAAAVIGNQIVDPQLRHAESKACM